MLVNCFHWVMGYRKYLLGLSFQIVAWHRLVTDLFFLSCSFLKKKECSLKYSEKPKWDTTSQLTSFQNHLVCSFYGRADMTVVSHYTKPPLLKPEKRFALDWFWSSSIKSNIIHSTHFSNHSIGRLSLSPQWECWVNGDIWQFVFLFFCIQRYRLVAFINAHDIHILSFVAGSYIFSLTQQYPEY